MGAVMNKRTFCQWMQKTSDTSIALISYILFWSDGWFVKIVCAVRSLIVTIQVVTKTSIKDWPRVYKIESKLKALNRATLQEKLWLQSKSVEQSALAVNGNEPRFRCWFESPRTKTRANRKLLTGKKPKFDYLSMGTVENWYIWYHDIPSSLTYLPLTSKFDRLPPWLKEILNQDEW